MILIFFLKNKRYFKKPFKKRNKPIKELEIKIIS